MKLERGIGILGSGILTLAMKETFVDPETGWTVTRERKIEPEWGGEVFEETITDPQSGETHHCKRSSSSTTSIADYVLNLRRELVGGVSALVSAHAWNSDLNQDLPGDIGVGLRKRKGRHIN